MRNKALICAGLAVLVMSPALRAQFTPYYLAQRNAAAYRAGFLPGNYYAPPFGYNPGYYFRTPAEGALSGSASLLRAQGQYGIDRQQARLLNQRVEQERIHTRRLLLEQRAYEASLRPTYEDLRIQRQQQALRRSMNDPPLTEIISGDSLNVLLEDQKKQLANNIVGPTVALDPYALDEINVTSSTSGGSIGIFRNRGKLSWPYALRSKAFAPHRERINELSEQAARAAASDEVTPEMIRDLTKQVDELERDLDASIHDIPPNDFIPAKKFVGQLRDGIVALKAPGVDKYFTGKWRAQGGSVSDLVSFMSKEGLEFSPATQGSENAYESLHRSMVNYQSRTLSMLQSRRQPE